MNTIIKMLALSLAVSTPAMSFAQSTSDSMTRAQVQGQLVRLDQAGYRQNKTHYPADIQSAENRMAAQGTAASNTNASYGGAADAMAQSGQRLPNVPNGMPGTLYGHH
ncbi:MAG TPA: DUF4148 domain-containing protein [Paraburkholderia sp.]|nr:DUF4148 domain-containing protein [Paraburkholderia sp.]